jgi:hypothetical protein
MEERGQIQTFDIRAGFPSERGKLDIPIPTRRRLAEPIFN